MLNPRVVIIVPRSHFVALDRPTHCVPPSTSSTMAQNQAIADTIVAMKAAMKRKSDDNKLKPRARHAQQHRLGDSTHWRERVNHAGYIRNTISTNPKRYDKYGYVYSPAASDDEELDEDAEIEAAEDNPFGEVQLENLLRPLTSAAELAEHPSLKVAYESKALTQMADEAAETLRRERASLYKAKRLLRRFRGDGDWVPCGLFETDNDEYLLGGHGGFGLQSDVTGTTLEQPAPDLDIPSAHHLEEDRDPAKGLVEAACIQDGEAMDGVERVDQAAPVVGSVVENGDAMQRDMETAEPINEDTSEPVSEPDTEPTNGHLPTAPTTADDALNKPPCHPAITDLAECEANSETASNSNATERHAMTTRARARSPAERTPSPSPSDSASIPDIHPWFIAPLSALTDRDLGLPTHEAEDTRKLLLLYVQKQEQICRSLDELCSGLQKADRLRKHVYRSAKAEGHVVYDGKGNAVTEMSDGEDWYDVKDWGLEDWELKDGALEKGKDEVEDVEEERRGRPGRGRRVNRI